MGTSGNVESMLGPCGLGRTITRLLLYRCSSFRVNEYDLSDPEFRLAYGQCLRAESTERYFYHARGRVMEMRWSYVLLWGNKVLFKLGTKTSQGNRRVNNTKTDVSSRAPEEKKVRNSRIIIDRNSVWES